MQLWISKPIHQYLLEQLSIYRMSKCIKKIVILTLVVPFVFSLSACDYSYYLYHNTDGNQTFLNKDVTIIQLIKYENLSVQNDPLREYELDLNTLEILEPLIADNIESFVNELIKIGGLSGKFKQVINSPNGIGIRIIYDDESFTLITTTVIDGRDCIFLGEYDADANRERYFGISWQEMIDDFKTLINEYFTMKIS